MSIIDNWIPKIARKNFSDTMNWVDAFVVLLLGFLLAALIYLDITPVDITVPMIVASPHQLLLHQDYADVLPKKQALTLKKGDIRLTIHILHKTYSDSRYITILTQETLPFENKDTVRLIIFRRTILDMLLRSKSSQFE